MTTVGSQIRKLSHKAFRALLKKFRRKKKRQQLAIAREKEELLEQQKREASPNFQAREEERRRNAQLWDEFQEKERNRKHREWLLREEKAQAEFRRKKKLQEEEKARKEEERKRMLAELEEKNLLETVEAEQNKKEKEKKEEALQEALSGLPQGNEPWHNPIAPENYNAGIEREQCVFFAKTGCCRFGERCSRGHLYPDVSTTILIRGMYSHFSIEQSNRDDYDTDMALEFEDCETYKDFKNFYDDVLPEFKKCGRVVQFKVCCNHEPHLRGNVYVQYSREEYAVEAYKNFNGRFYAGKQLSCEFTVVKNWKSAICGLFVSKRCPKGNNCNFLHVFKNPNNEFWAADRNLPDYPNKKYQNFGYSNSQRSYHSHHSSRRSRYSDSYCRNDDRSPISSRSSHRSSPTRKSQYSSDSDFSGNDHNSKFDETNSQPNNKNNSHHHRRRKRRKRRSSSKSDSSMSSEGEKKHKAKHKKSRKRRKRSHSNSCSRE